MNSAQERSFPSRCHGKLSLGRLNHSSSLSSLRISRQFRPPLVSCPRYSSQIVLPSTKKPGSVTPVPISLLSTADKRVLWAGGDFCQEVLPQSVPVHCGCWGRPGVGRERQQQMTEHWFPTTEKVKAKKHLEELTGGKSLNGSYGIFKRYRKAPCGAPTHGFLIYVCLSMKQGAEKVCSLQKCYTNASQLLVTGLLSLHLPNLE